MRCLDPSEAACKAYAADCEANREQEAASTTFDLGFSPGGSAGAGRPHVILRLEAETAAETRVSALRRHQALTLCADVLRLLRRPLWRSCGLSSGLSMC